MTRQIPPGKYTVRADIAHKEGEPYLVFTICEGEFKGRVIRWMPYRGFTGEESEPPTVWHGKVEDYEI